VGLARDRVVAQHLGQPPGGGKFGISQVGDDLGDGPFLRRGPAEKLFSGLALDQRCQLPRRSLLQAQRIFVPGIAQESLGVFLDGFRHVLLLASVHAIISKTHSSRQNLSPKTSAMAPQGFPLRWLVLYIRICGSMATCTGSSSRCTRKQLLPFSPPGLGWPRIGVW